MIYAYGTGYQRVAAPANGFEREVDLDDVYFAPGVHVRLLLFGKLEGRVWDIRLNNGGMELRDRDPRKSIVVVVESRDIASWEDGLPPPM